MVVRKRAWSSGSGQNGQFRMVNLVVKRCLVVVKCEIFTFPRRNKIGDRLDSDTVVI